VVGFDFKILRRVLCLGAHSDDIEIGCGGTILELLRCRPGIQVVWVVFSAEGIRATEAESSARTFLKGTKRQEVIVHDFKGSFFPFYGEAIKEAFEKLKQTFKPDLVFTHYRADRHQDHRVISDLTWNTFRNHLVLEYEILKYDGDLGQPNVFVPLDANTCRKKVAALKRFFQTQSNKHWFDDDVFLGLMRLRGVECASPTKYAEAFYARKVVLGGSESGRHPKVSR
jgi:LmbE family N-acetylglucosaminyl deacetylase